MPDMTTFRKTALVVYWGFHRWCVHSTGEQEPRGSVVFCRDGNMFPCQQVRPTGKWEECGRKWVEKTEKCVLYERMVFKYLEQKDWERKKRKGSGERPWPKISQRTVAHAGLHACASSQWHTHMHSHVHIHDFRYSAPFIKLKVISSFQQSHKKAENNHTWLKAESKNIYK